MSRFSRIFAVLFVLLLIGAPVMAQEVTPPPDVGAPVNNIIIEEGGNLTVDQVAPLSPVPEEEAPPALAVLLTMAATVAGFVELVKPWLNDRKTAYGWSDNLHTFVVRLVAFGAALVIVFLTTNSANLITAWSLTLDLPLWLVKSATALGISFGSAFLWAGFRFLKLLPIVTTMVPAGLVPVDARSSPETDPRL